MTSSTLTLIASAPTARPASPLAVVGGSLSSVRSSIWLSVDSMYSSRGWLGWRRGAIELSASSRSTGMPPELSRRSVGIPVATADRSMPDVRRAADPGGVPCGGHAARSITAQRLPGPTGASRLAQPRMCCAASASTSSSSCSPLSCWRPPPRRLSWLPCRLRHRHKAIMLA